tara:strand:- start:281 stop:544 length:264 start_codon:yes stop_codon:yes gene_type:complete
MIISLIVYDEKKIMKLKEDFNKPVFVIFFTCIVTIIILGLNYGSKRIRNAILHATIAFIIAVLAHLDMVFSAFFLVGIFVYYTDKQF